MARIRRGSRPDIPLPPPVVDKWEQYFKAQDWNAMLMSQPASEVPDVGEPPEAGVFDWPYVGRNATLTGLAYTNKAYDPPYMSNMEYALEADKYYGLPEYRFPVAGEYPYLGTPFANSDLYPSGRRSNPFPLTEDNALDYLGRRDWMLPYMVSPGNVALAWPNHYDALLENTIMQGLGSNYPDSYWTPR